MRTLIFEGSFRKCEDNQKRLLETIFFPHQLYWIGIAKEDGVASYEENLQTDHQGCGILDHCDAHVGIINYHD